MSEYRRQILVGGVAAVIVGIILIASIAYLPLVSTTSISATTSSFGSGDTTRVGGTTSLGTTQSSSAYTSNQPISFVPGSLGICLANCNYPSPYLAAEVLVNSTSPLRSLRLYINATYESTSTYTNNFTTPYIIEYKANPTNQTLPIVSGRTYGVSLLASFGDGSASTASSVVVPIVIGNETTVSSSVVSCSTTYSNYTVNSASLYLSPNSGSTASLCVKYFYYNTTAPVTINALDQLTIYAPVQSSGTLSNVNLFFLISANLQRIQIGGPQLVNEGTTVIYTIRSIGSAPSATYEIGLSSGLYPRDIICGFGIYVTLQVGNTTNTEVGTSCHYVPAPVDNPGLVYSEIVGMTNST
ncbi:MAG: hypothetical protein ACYC7D_07845 [Nitrososphaerales archaeon]